MLKRLLIPVTIVFAWMPALVMLGVMVFSLFHGLINGFSPQQKEMAVTSGLHTFLLGLWALAVLLSFWSMCSISFGLKMGFLWRLFALIIGSLAYLMPLAFFFPLVASYSLRELLIIILGILTIAAVIHLVHIALHLRLILQSTK